MIRAFKFLYSNRVVFYEIYIKINFLLKIPTMYDKI